MHPRFLACITGGRMVASNEIEIIRGGTGAFFVVCFLIFVFSFLLSSQLSLTAKFHLNTLTP